MARLSTGLLVAVLLVASCGDDGQRLSESEGEAEPQEEEQEAVETMESFPTAAELCADAAPADPADTVASPDLVEISGIALSREHDGIIWSHNDSGSQPELFAVGEDGSDLGTFTIEGAEAIDWEDMTIGPGPQEGTDYLYVGDTGDNFDEPQRLEDPIRIYRVPEPADRPDGPGTSTATAERIDIAYADGPRDAETLMADPTNGVLLIVSKQWDGTLAGVYEVPAQVVAAEQAPAEPVQLERVADVPETEGVFVTGGEVSPDGSLVALRTYTEVRLFDRASDQTVADALADGADCTVPVDEPQGEAVAVAASNSGFVTISEGESQPVNWHLLP